MIPGTDWYFRVSRGVCFTGYQLSFRVSRGVFFYRVPVVLPGFSWRRYTVVYDTGYRLVLPGFSWRLLYGYQLSFRVSRGVDTRLSTVEILVAAVTNVVRSPYRRSTVIHRRKNNCVSILINFIQYQPI